MRIFHKKYIYYNGLSKIQPYEKNRYPDCSQSHIAGVRINMHLLRSLVPQHFFRACDIVHDTTVESRQWRKRLLLFIRRAGINGM